MPELFFDGRPVPVAPDQTVAAALWQAGVRAWRTTRVGQQPRGLFCGIGACHDCLVTVDGSAGERACVTPARPGAAVSTTASSTVDVHGRRPRRRRGAGSTSRSSGPGRPDWPPPRPRRWAADRWRCSTPRPGSAGSTGGTGRAGPSPGPRRVRRSEVHCGGTGRVRPGRDGVVRRAGIRPAHPNRDRGGRPDRARHRCLRPGAAVPRLGPARGGHARRGPGPAQGLRRGGRARGCRGRGRAVPAAGRGRAGRGRGARGRGRRGRPARQRTCASPGA